MGGTGPGGAGGDAVGRGMQVHLQQVQWDNRAIRKKFQEELDNLVKKGVLTKLDKNEVAEWLNSFVICYKAKW